ncbi:hypothetical protein VTN00DRAFT_7167 [Thermoascus crustaceus]|uniref:uncharacterized protein n=1 Tax=Thermoascus crustaceus TaxID=5088 RepID=UPI0037445C99
MKLYAGVPSMKRSIPQHPRSCKRRQVDLLTESSIIHETGGAELVGSNGWLLLGASHGRLSSNSATLETAASVVHLQQDRTQGQAQERLLQRSSVEERTAAFIL